MLTIAKGEKSSVMAQGHFAKSVSTVVGIVRGTRTDLASCTMLKIRRIRGVEDSKPANDA